MPTYLIKKEKPITRQEGDTAEVVVVVPDVIDMGSYEVQFKVTDSSRRAVFSKSSGAGTITVSGQTVTIPIAADDTKRKPGKHSWEMQITNNTPEVITIGRGPFVIVGEMIR